MRIAINQIRPYIIEFLNRCENSPTFSPAATGSDVEKALIDLKRLRISERLLEHLLEAMQDQDNSPENKYFNSIDTERIPSVLAYPMMYT